MEQEIVIVKIPELIATIERNPNGLLVYHNPATNRAESISVAELINGEVIKAPWDLNYPYQEFEIVTWNSKFWESKVNDNEGNQPAENEFWHEISASTANGGALRPWAAGVFDSVNSSVTYNDAGYFLRTSQTLPFNSAGIAAEITAGIWLPLGVNPDLTNYIKKTGETTIPEMASDDAICKTPLYNYYAQSDPRGICPIGWHIPTQAEWDMLATTQGGASVAGGRLKDAGLTNWNSPNSGYSQNTLNFVGSGYRNFNGIFLDARQIYSPAIFGNGFVAAYYNSATLYIDTTNTSAFKDGKRIRCVKDDNIIPTGPVLDADGNSYNFVQLGPNIWLKEDLKTTHYNNGDLIQNIINDTTWKYLTTGARCYYPPINKYKSLVYTPEGDAKLLTPSTPSSETITVDNGAAYDDSVIYNTVTVVVFSNPSSPITQFQTPQLYQSTVPLSIAGIDPEESPYNPELATGNWWYIGDTLDVSESNTAITYIKGRPASVEISAITKCVHNQTISLSSYNSVLRFDKNSMSGIRPIDIPSTSPGRWVAYVQMVRKQLYFNNATEIANIPSPSNGDNAIDNSTGFVYAFVVGNFTGIVALDYFEGEEGSFVKIGETGEKGFITLVQNTVVSALTTVSKTIVGAINWLKNLTIILKEPTGFRYPELVDVSYNPTTRVVTLTGNCEAYYRGDVIPELVSGWLSEPHAIGDNSYFLYYDGTDFIWSNTVWPFDVVMIAMAYRDGVNFCIRECHGLMSHLTHQELHEVIGTYLKSGGDITNYTLASTAAANRRPQISLTTIKDEDLPTQLPALTTNAYTQLSLSGTNTANTISDAVDIIALSTNQPYYNQFTGGNWVQTLFTNNAYGKIFVMAIPTTSDAECQKKRFIFIQPQTISTTLATIQAVNSSSVNLGHISASLSEYVFIGEIIIRYAAGNWTLISVSKISGSKISQSIIQGGGGGASTAADLAVDATGFNGNLLPTDTNQQLVNQKFDDYSPLKEYQIETESVTTGLISFSQLEKIIAIPTKYNIDILTITPSGGGAAVPLITAGGVIVALPLNLAVGTYNVALTYTAGNSTSSTIIQTQLQ